MIDPEQVRHVAALARLALTEVELDRLRQQLGQILEAFEALNELDVEQISPTAQVIPLTNIERDDRARPSLRPEQVMMVAAHQSDLLAAQKVGLKTAFVPRPLEGGAGNAPDPTPDPSFDYVASDFVNLASQLGA